ncbi:Alpha/Beta hydrolase protein [Xylogone sp. PMI_703]|nr:Alpha/Beta hydrolase protein [Xylogone sp. PMI_703]
MNRLVVPNNETPCKRAYFYVGGEYVLSGSDHILRHQMYVEQLDPVDGATKPYPLVLIHGLGQTGTNWLNKPDGGRGWASFFLERGYQVYIIDATVRGRSPDLDNDNELRKFSAEFLEIAFTACAHYKRWPQASLHSQWPGSGRRGDPIFDEYFASVVPSLVNKEYQQTTLQKAGAALLDRIGRPVILIGHSQGMMPTWLIADSRPALVHAVVALEPAGPPFEETGLLKGLSRPYGLTTIPITYSPPVTDPEKDLVRQIVTPNQLGQVPLSIQADDPPPRQLVNFLETPVLLVTAEASYHAPYDWATVAYLRQAGVRKTEHLVLADHGLRGNGHMFFMEKNSDEIAMLVDGWINKIEDAKGKI